MGTMSCDQALFLPIKMVMVMVMVVMMMILVSMKPATIEAVRVSEEAYPSKETQSLASANTTPNTTTNTTPNTTTNTTTNVTSTPNATVNAYLSGHNAARAAVRVRPLVWNETLAAFARRHAASVNASNKCRQLVASRGPYGENKFWGSSGKAWRPQDAVNTWVRTSAFYNASTNTCAPRRTCGEYTQVVWRATTQLGCASVVCRSIDDGSTFIVCNYSPPGNVSGRRPF